MKTKIYFIRHGETSWNVEKRYQGWTDIELSEVGVKQAKLLGERFKNINVDKIYASPLKRAFETARQIGENTGVDVVIDESFKEINFGEWEGGTISELTEKYGDEYLKFFNTPWATTFPGDGSFKNIESRMAKGIDRILKEDKGKSIVIVSHGGLLKILLLYVMGLPEDFYKKVWLDNTAVSLIEVNSEGKPLLRILNDKSHLDNM